ncbi:class I SAM-dependent methyltransferase [Poriferisphaera sp. WC338]|uniref:class I SAM-dependent methyltransferase n=1 Tax=Poriferisphaera sp. WC338 TaxID=3425129 RepID=UPI003D81663F
MHPPRFYNSLAPFYNILRDYPYTPIRRNLTAAMNLTSGSTVFDLCCGTGMNFPYLAHHISDNGKIIAIDGSPAMLKRARKCAGKLKAQQPNLIFDFIELDLTSYAAIDTLTTIISQHQPTHFICTLGFTCLPNSQSLLKLIYDQAQPQSTFALFDVHTPKKNFSARLINLIGACDAALDPASHLASLNSHPTNRSAITTDYPFKMPPFRKIAIKSITLTK